MAQNKFRGLGIALITPFQTDGSIDFDALDRLVEYQIKGGADFLCIMGTTAETPTLSREEKRLLKERLVNVTLWYVMVVRCYNASKSHTIFHLKKHANAKLMDYCWHTSKRNARTYYF